MDDEVNAAVEASWFFEKFGLVERAEWVDFKLVLAMELLNFVERDGNDEDDDPDTEWVAFEDWVEAPICDVVPLEVFRLDLVPFLGYEASEDATSV